MNYEAPINELGTRQLIDAVAAEKFESLQENWYKWHKYDAAMLPVHGQGATLTAPSLYTIGGYLLDANTEYLYPSIYLDDDYAGGNVEMFTFFETNESNIEGRAQDRIRINCRWYYKDLRPRLNRAVDPYEVVVQMRDNQWSETQIGRARRHTPLIIRHSFANGADITLRTNSILKARINLCTAHSDGVDLIYVNYVLIGYPTRKVHNPLTTPKSSE